MDLALNLGFGSSSGAGASISVSMSGLTNNPTYGSTAQITTHASIGATMSDAEAISAYKWGSTLDGTEYGTGSAPTDFAAGDGGTLYLTATSGGVDYYATATIRYAAPSAAGSLSDQSFTVSTGDQTYDTSGDFTGSGITYTVNSVTGISIASGTGVVTHGTNVMAEQTGTTITVTATNTGGSDTSAYSLDIVAAASEPVPFGPTITAIPAGSGTTVVTIPGTPAEDDYVITMRSQDDGSAIPATTGYTEIAAHNGGTPSVKWEYKKLGSTPDTTVTFNQNTGGVAVSSVFLARGLDPTTFIDSAYLSQSGNSGTTSFPSITTATDNALVLVSASLDDDNSGVTSYPSGYTNTGVGNAGGSSGSTSSIAVAAKIVATAGSEPPGNLVWSTGSDQWRGSVIALKPAPTSAVVGGTGLAYVSPRYVYNSETVRIERIPTGALAWSDVTVNTATVGGVDVSGDFDGSGNLDLTGQEGVIAINVTVDGSTYDLDAGYCFPVTSLTASAIHTTLANNNGWLAGIPAYPDPGTVTDSPTTKAQFESIISGATQDSTYIIDDIDLTGQGIIDIPNSFPTGVTLVAKNHHGVELDGLEMSGVKFINITGFDLVGDSPSSVNAVESGNLHAATFTYCAIGSSSLKPHFTYDPDTWVTFKYCVHLERSTDGQISFGTRSTSPATEWGQINIESCIFGYGNNSDTLRVNGSDRYNGTVLNFYRTVLVANRESTSGSHPDMFQAFGGLIKGVIHKCIVTDYVDTGEIGAQGVFIADGETQDLLIDNNLLYSSLNSNAVTVDDPQRNVHITNNSVYGDKTGSTPTGSYGALTFDNNIGEASSFVGVSDTLSVETNHTDADTIGITTVWPAMSTASEMTWEDFVPAVAYDGKGAQTLIDEIEAVVP